MDIRLIAVDLDGTLLKNDKTLSPATIRAVAQAAKAGVEVAFATGRGLCECSGLLAQLPDVRYAVSCTGAQVLDCRTGREIFFSPLPTQMLREIWRRLRDYDMFFEVFYGPVILVPGEEYSQAERFEALSGNPNVRTTRTPMEDFDGFLENLEKPVTKIHIYFASTALREKAWDEIRDLDVYSCTSDPIDLEIMARGIDKGTGLSHLADYLALRPDQIMAVGDSGNDLGMLQYAGVRAVMANGTEDLKALAHIIADTNEHDGVAHLLEDLAAGVLDAAPAARPRLN